MTEQPISAKSGDIIPVDKKEELGMSIGKNIKKLREELGLTQKQFAKRLGMQDKQLCRYEVDGCLPSIKILKKIADLCETSLDQVVYGNDARISKRTKIADKDLLQLFRRIDKMKKTERELYRWLIISLLNNRQHLPK